MIGKKLLFFVLCALAVLLTVSPAAADTIQFSLASPNQTANTGDVVSFTATVAAPNTNFFAVFLNNDSHTEDAGLTINDNPFLSNFPLSMSPGDSTTAILFDATITGGPGVYSGFFDILGGGDSSTFDLLGSTQYNITVGAAPEPATILLMAAGLLGLLGIRQVHSAETGTDGTHSRLTSRDGSASTLRSCEAAELTF